MGRALGGEGNGRWPVAIWSPEARRRRAQAAARSGARGGAATERERASGEGEEVEELTARRKKGPWVA